MIKFTTAALLSLLVLHSPAHAAHHVSITRFRAELEASFVQPQTDPEHHESTATAVANFVLTTEAGDPGATTLSYDILFDGLELIPSDTNLDDDITAIHIHDTTVCVFDSLCGDGNGGQVPDSTVGTRHVLNIWGAPRNGDDDNDVQTFPLESRITGRWDPTDANTLTPAPTQSIADPAILDLLFAGKLALMVHTNLVGSGEIGGFLVQVPEPSSILLALAAVGMIVVRRSR